MATIKKFKVCRRLGAGVFEQCQTQRFVLSQQKRARVSNSKRAPKRPSDYGLSLIEKQKVRFAYGVSEKQFANYVEKAFGAAKKGQVPADKLFSLLEHRLDNVVYRLGIAHTRAFARQLVSHGHIVVNGKKVDVPSFMVSLKDVITIREGSKNKPVFAGLADKLKQATAPEWLKLTSSTFTAEVIGTPKNPDPFMNFQAVIEFYSR